MNGDWSFQASKWIHKHHKNSAYDLGTILEAISSHTIALWEGQAEMYSIIISSGLLGIYDQLFE